MDCERPLLVSVSVEGQPFTHDIWPCKNHRASKCRPCSARYGRRVESVAVEGMFKPDGAHYLLTLTPPGDRLHCMKSGCVATECAHEKCSCTPEGGVSLGEWNPTASTRWNHLLTLIERSYGGRPQYFRAVECQDGKRTEDGCGRMGLHLHVLLRTDRVLNVRTVRRLAIQAGFGHAVDIQVLSAGSRKAAKYVAKYVTKSCDERDDVPWLVDQVDQETGEVTTENRPATFRTWSQSRRWGTTMAEICVDLRRRWDARQAELDRDQAQGLVICAKSPREQEPD